MQTLLLLAAILNAETSETGFEHLTAEDRTAMLAILGETKPGLLN